MFNHFIITRFNSLFLSTGFGNNPLFDTHDSLGNDWLRYRINLFKETCLNSIKNQSSKNFIWLILVHEDTPDSYKIELEKLCKDYNILYTTEQDREELYKDNSKSQWPNNVYPAIQEMMDSKYCIQTRFDNDDFLHKDFVKNVQLHAENIIENNSNKILPFIVHGPYGYLRFKKGIYFIEFNYMNQFLSLVRRKEDSHLNIFDEGHADLYKIAPQVFHRTDVSWMITIHDNNYSQNVMQYLRVRKGHMMLYDLAKIRQKQNLNINQIKKDFGI